MSLLPYHYHTMRVLQTSSDGALLAVHSMHRLYVFQLPDSNMTFEEALAISVDLFDPEPQAPRAVRSLPNWHMPYCRDGHILAVPAGDGPLHVFDMDLKPLWRVRCHVLDYGLHFVGESLFINGQGMVFDWRRRRRWIGTVDYNVAMRLNRR